MQVKFQVASPFDFTKYSYVVVFNTTGDGKTPVANATTNGFAGYSLAIVLSGTSPTATAWIYDRSQNIAQPFLRQVFPLGQDLQLISNSNGINTQFTVIFNRLIASAFAASPSPTPSPTATPTPGPTATPTGSPAPTPTPTPGAVASNWNFNFFVTSGQWGSNSSTPVDSLGHSPNGATDVTYASQTLNTAVSFDTGTFQPIAGVEPTDSSATIFSGDISNNP